METEICSGRDILIFLAVKHQGHWNAIYDEVKTGVSETPEEIRAVAQRYEGNVVTILDENYPERLFRDCPKPPFVLFYRGDLSLASKHLDILAVVGSRLPTEYARKKVYGLCAELVQKGKTIITGLASGIDTSAALEASKIQGGCIGVLGCGIHRCYPVENEELFARVASNGLLLSEYPDYCPPTPAHFPMRNRIVAALSNGVFIGEAKPKSGTLITLAFAAEMGRDVAALPFQADEEIVNNFLIQNGAALIEKVEDLLLFMSSSKRPLDLSGIKAQ